MHRKRIWIVGAIFLLSPFLLSPWPGFSDTLRISQIDSRTLLVDQKVRVYVSVTDDEGEPVGDLRKDNFVLYEVATGGFGEKREILTLEHGVNVNQGINFLLIIDNSGSMYWDSTGKIKNSKNEEIWRITEARRAITSLLKEIKNPLDRVGLISFNVKIDMRVKPTANRVAIQRALAQIKKPPEEEAYTELYETIYQAVDDLRTAGGRKVIIVFSDGVNFPLKENPYFPHRVGRDGAVAFAQREGISVFTIGFSEKADHKNLGLVAKDTGGAHFAVYDTEQIARLYSLIREQVLNEYLITYRATMLPSEKRMVRIRFTGDGKRAEASRFYFSGTIFGFPQSTYRYLILLIVPAGVVLIILLSFLKFEWRREEASLSVLGKAGGRMGKQTTIIPRGKNAVTISGSYDADLTVPGDMDVSKTEARVEYKGGQYTLRASGGSVTVNRRSVKTKVLRSGDLIQLGDTTVVFDAGVKTDGTKKKGKRSKGIG